jgi:hypothetical protein
MTSLKPYEFIFGKYCYDPNTQRTRGDLLPLYKRWPRITPERLAEQFGLTTSEMTNIANPMSNRESSMAGPAGTPSEERNPTITLTQIYGSPPSFASPTPNSGRRTSTGVRDSFYSGPVMEIDSILSEATMFRGVDRMKLIHQIISYKGVGGCALDPAQLLKDECILAYAPLHDMVELRELEAEWITFFDFPWNQPVDKVKNYFGEKIGLYFKWLGFYTTWLFPAALLGFFIWIDIAANGNF